MYCIAHIDTEKDWRGGQQQVYSLMRGLNSHNVRNVAIVRKDGELHKRLIGAEIPVLPLSPRFEFDPWAAWKIRNFLVQEGVNLLHAHSAHAVSLAALSTRNATVPYVVTRRVDYPIGANLFSRWKYQGAAHIFCVTADIQRVLEKGGLPRTKTSVVHSGLDFSRFEALQPITKKDLGFDEENTVIGQAAALSPQKDPFTFVAAIKRVMGERPEVRGVMVGDGPLRGEVEGFIQKLGLQQKIRLVGFRSDVLRYVKGFDLFCMSSREEGICMAIVEAMALRVPVVATRVGGIPEVIIDNETGFLAPAGDPQLFAARIEDVLQHHGSLDEILNRAQARARDFDVRQTIEQTHRVYRSILDPK